MPVKSLPSNPSLEHLKYQARDLLDALNRGNAEAIARVREFHLRFARVSDDEIRASKLSLADAQLVIAREYGFQSWPKLKHHIEVSAQAVGSSARSLSSFKLPAGPVELKQKWPSGACIVKEMNLKQNMEIQTPGKPDPVKHQLCLSSQYAYTVVKELPSGGREVELQYLSFRLEYESGGFLWRYDSAQKSAADQSPVAELFKTIMSWKVRYSMDATNRLERMEGVDELVDRLNVLEGAKLKPGMPWDNKALDKVLNRMTSGAQPLEGIASGLRIMYSKDHFKSRVDSAFLPGNAVQPGDTWNYSRESKRHNVFSVGVIRDCTVMFQGWDIRAERVCSRLEFRGTEKTAIQSEAASVRMPVTDGTFSGVIWFDPEAGRGIEVNSNHDFKVTRAGAGQMNRIFTDHHHQIITEKLISVNEPGGSS